MSEVHVEERSSLIKTPRQLIVVVLLAFLIPVIGIVMIVNFVTGGLKVDRGDSEHSAAAVAERLKPVGSVIIGEVPAPAAQAQPAGATPAVKSTSGGAVKTAAAGDAGAGKKNLRHGLHGLSCSGHRRRTQDRRQDSMETAHRRRQGRALQQRGQRQECHAGERRSGVSFRCRRKSRGGLHGQPSEVISKQ